MNKVAEVGITNSFNGEDISQNWVYFKKRCVVYIGAVIERLGWTDPVQRETKIVEHIFPGSMKEVKSIPGLGTEN